MDRLPPASRLPREGLGLYVPDNSVPSDMREIYTGHPGEEDFDINGVRHHGFYTHESYSQHPGHASVHDIADPPSPRSASVQSHDYPLSPFPLPGSLYDFAVHSVPPVGPREETQIYSPSRLPSRSHSPSIDSDTTLVGYRRAPPPTPPGYPPPPSPHHGDYIYAQSTNRSTLPPELAVEPHDWNARTSVADNGFLSPPAQPHRNRSGSGSSQNSHSSRQSQISRSRSRADTPAQVSGFLSPPQREHRSRSGSRSSRESHCSGCSHHSTSHSGNSSRSQSHSPLPSLSHSPYLSASPSPTNRSFIQPSPDQPIILPIGPGGENGFVVVPAQGQDVIVIPVRSVVSYQPGWTGPYDRVEAHGRIEEVSSMTNDPAPRSKTNRFKALFSRKKK